MQCPQDLYKAGLNTNDHLLTYRLFLVHPVVCIQLWIKDILNGCYVCILHVFLLSSHCLPMFFMFSHVFSILMLCFSKTSFLSSTVYCLLSRYKLFTLLLLIFSSMSFNASSRLPLVVALLSYSIIVSSSYPAMDFVFYLCNGDS